MSSNYQTPSEAAEGYVEVGGEPTEKFVRCPVCKGSGIDPACKNSHQDDEWDCTYCAGYGDVEAF